LLIISSTSLFFTSGLWLLTTAEYRNLLLLRLLVALVIGLYFRIVCVKTNLWLVLPRRDYWRLSSLVQPNWIIRQVCSQLVQTEYSVLFERYHILQCHKELFPENNQIIKKNNHHRCQYSQCFFQFNILLINNYLINDKHIFTINKLTARWKKFLSFNLFSNSFKASMLSTNNFLPSTKPIFSDWIFFPFLADSDLSGDIRISLLGFPLLLLFVLLSLSILAGFYSAFSKFHYLKINDNFFGKIIHNSL